MEGLPENCEAAAELLGDNEGLSIDQLESMSALNGNDARAEYWGELDLDSLDAVEVSMTAEECGACEPDGTGCALGRALIEMTTD